MWWMISSSWQRWRKLSQCCCCSLGCLLFCSRVAVINRIAVEWLWFPVCLPHQWGQGWESYSRFCWCRSRISYIHSAITSCWYMALWSLQMNWVNFQSQARDGTLHHYLWKCWLRTSAGQWLVLCWEDHGHCVVSEKEIPFIISDPGQWQLVRGRVGDQRPDTFLCFTIISN